MSNRVFGEMNRGSVNSEDKYIAIINNKRYKEELTFFHDYKTSSRLKGISKCS